MPRKSSVKKPTDVEGRKRRHVYDQLNNKIKTRSSHAYETKPYEYFKSIRWDDWWKDFLECNPDGTFKYKTPNQLAREKTSDKEEQRWIYAAIGPTVEKSPNQTRIVPYLGDWGNIRSSLFIGETDRESLIYGNPKVAALRETLRRHIDVLEFSKGIGEVLLDWLGRFTAYAQQIDEYFDYKIVDKKLSFEENEKRFNQYMKMQKMLFHRCIDASRQILRCVGVGEDDIGLLAQMAIAGMRQKFDPETFRMMQAAAAGVVPSVIEGAEATPQGPTTEGDNKALDAVLGATPALKLMLTSFTQKAAIYRMPHPDIEIEGVGEDDTRTDPAKDPKVNIKKGKSVN
jgi:hypothetical protein